jgi:hypothetical protein
MRGFPCSTVVTSILAVVMVLLSIEQPRSVPTEKRLALVMGNWSYAPSVGGELKNPGHDVALIAAALRMTDLTSKK